MVEEAIPQQSVLSDGGVPDEFVAQVRNAFMHLYDRAHLQRHPLARLAGRSGDPFNDGAMALRNVLLDTLEQLRPAPSVSPSDREWRPYAVLLRRYVNGFSIAEVIDELHISVRQFHREHQKGLLAVAEILWRRWHGQLEQPTEGPAPSLADSLQGEVQQLGVELARVNMAAVLETVLGPAQALAREMRVQLEVRAPRQPQWAWADATLARQALLGALSATLLARPQRVEVTWGGTKAERFLMMACEPHLPNDGSAEARAREGRLRAVEELVRAQGGRLDIILEESELAAVRLAFRRQESRRVLLIDDNERLLRLFERYLSAEGFAVTAVTDASQALGSIGDEPPDAIVLDVMMRDTDGCQLLQRLRSDTALAEVPIVVCSVLHEPELARVLGAQAYLKKPVSQRQLLAALQEVLGGSNREEPPSGGR
jgi:CheY-like chemotaxis protein